MSEHVLKSTHIYQDVHVQRTMRALTLTQKNKVLEFTRLANLAIFTHLDISESRLQTSMELTRGLAVGLREGLIDPMEEERQ